MHKKDVKMPRGENDAAKSRGSALSFVISMLHRMMTTLLRWEACSGVRGGQKASTDIKLSKEQLK